jgi:vacuolar-type H+-ATPase subunit F/Vma7
MSLIVVIGEEPRVTGFALAGARVEPAADAESARRIWSGLAADIELVVLTPSAARAVEGMAGPPRRLKVVLPA